MTFSTICLILLVYSVLGFWLSTIERVQAFGRAIRPTWLSWIVIKVMDGPVLWALSILWWLLNVGPDTEEES